MAVVRTCGGFRMILHAKGRDFAMRKAFDGVVVQAAVCDLQERWQRIFSDCEAVVLRCDFDRSGLQILHRMVRAAVAELDLEGFRAAGKAEELVAQADAEDRLLTQEVADSLDRILKW